VIISKTFLVLNILLMQSVGNPASLQAEKINTLFNHFNIAAAAMLTFVTAMVVYICIRYRQKQNDDTMPPQTQGSYRLEAAMIGLPFIILCWFFYESIRTEKFVLPAVAASRQPDVIITAHQWWWEAQYPASGVITANEIHLPSGKHLLLELRSADVIHDWWVPSLGNKMDIIPGQKNYIWLDIEKPGEYKGACSEFCGAEHAWMRIDVLAQGENDFNTWLTENKKDASTPHDTIAMAGAALFQSGSCAGCHRIAGTAAISSIGPDLTHIASRKEMLTGIMEMNEKNLAAWIGHPQHIKPLAKMPDFHFSNDTVAAMAHYLSQLK
jgi:cytochrome c oxidase subunit 2